MTPFKFKIFSEFNSLSDVVLGTAESFCEGERINMAMKKYYGTQKSPKKNGLAREYQEIKKILQRGGVRVYEPIASSEVPQQLAPRDIGFVIGDTFFVSNMKRGSRKNEIDYLDPILKKFGGRVVKVPRNVYLEGGNIVVDEKKI
ncbi:MAG: hypothetical protein ABID04_04030, partial [Patescibacteria group bacterium]